MLGSVLGEARSIVNKHDDDIVDRYNHRYTVIALAIFIFVIASKQYFGEPITCWTPAQFTGSHNSYANTICWTHGTYPVGGDQPYHTVDRTQVLPYYQWVPFILLFQAACFMIPNLIWHTFSRSAGVDITSLGKNASSLDNFDMESREKTINQIARHIHIALSLKYDYSPTFKKFNLRDRLPFGRRHGNYLYIVYMIVKLVYIINIFCQLVLMNSFFGFKYHAYGLDFMKKFLMGDDYSRIDRAFPRVTFCDFKIRNLGDNIHQHSVQCALPINLFNEKFFICLWFWMIFLSCITIFNFFSWFKLILTPYRKKSIAKYLKSHNKLGNTEKDKELFNTFVKEYCHLDGAFIFSILRRNSNYITTSEIICTLYDKFCREFNRPPREHRQVLNAYAKETIEIGMMDNDDYDEKKPFKE